jgi:hypothetical protein
MSTVSKKTTVKRSSTGVNSAVPSTEFLRILKSASEQSAGYFWHVNCQDQDPEGLHHFLGMSFDSYDCFMKKELFRNTTTGVSSFAMVEKLANAIGGKPFAEATSYLYYYIDGKGKRNKQKRLYLRLGCKASTIEKVGMQYTTSHGAVESLHIWPAREHVPRLTDEERKFINGLQHTKDPGLDITSDNQPMPNDNKLKDEEEHDNELAERLYHESVAALFGQEAGDTRKARLLRRYLQKYIATILLNYEYSHQQEDEPLEVPAETVGADDEAADLGLQLKSFFTRKQRTLTIATNNGKDQLVVNRPFLQTIDGFITEAKRSKWIEDLLPTQDYRLAFLKYMAVHHTKDYQQVGRVYGSEIKQTVGTYEVAGLSTHIGLNSTQLEDLRAYLKTHGLHLGNSAEINKQIADEAGIRESSKPVIDTFIYEHEDAETEPCPYWNANIEEDICSEIEMHYLSCFLQHKNEDEESRPFVPQAMNYHPMGHTGEGINYLIGGDHGDGKFRMFMRFHFTSPATRKEKHDMSLGCPQIQISYIDCKKDRYELLKNTVMPEANQIITKLKQSSILLAYDRRNPTFQKAFIVPSDIQQNTIRIDMTGTLKYKVRDEWYSVVLPETRRPTVEQLANMEFKVVVKSFQGFLIGDLAFLATVLGLNNSDGYHCVLCEQNGRSFNCSDEQVNNSLRTSESNHALLEAFLSRRNKSDKNAKGVNLPALLGIEPDHVLVPILHCPMGIVDKVLESFILWIYLYVLRLDDPVNNGYRTSMREAEKRLASATQMVDTLPHTSVTAEDFAIRQEAKAELSLAKAARAKANKDFGKFCLIMKRERDGFHARYETILKKHGIGREHYHGGKLNGVMTQKMMEECEPIMDDIIVLLKELKDDTLIDDIAIDRKCEKYRCILGNQDAIWSAVCGIDGLLPTQEHIQNLKAAIEKGKQLWVELDLGTLQPKWHLAFDTHLLSQVVQYGGLADKTDEYIEKGHQYWRTFHSRYCRIASFNKQQLAIWKAERRSRHPRVAHEAIQIKKAKRSHSKETARKRQSEEKKGNLKEAKTEKRMKYST